MMIYEPLIWIFLISCAIFLIVTIALMRDVFHPNCLAMIFFAGTIGGGAIPLNSGNAPAEFWGLDFNHDLVLYTAGVWFFALGGLAAGNRVRARRVTMAQLYDNSLLRIAYFLGSIALLIYLAQVAAGGGFAAVYSQIKGRGDLGSGIQDFIFLSAPAGAMYLLAKRGRIVDLKSVLVLLLLLSPLLITGFLSSRRGFAAMALGSLFFGWYLARNERPSLLVLFSAAALGTFVLLSLVVFRRDVYLGSDILSRISFEMAMNRISDHFGKASEGHELVYGSSVIQSVRQQGDYWWGARYIAVIFLWPIPSFVFPDKYSAFGLDGMLYNAGTTGSDFLDALGTPGAAPMIIADTFVEFSYGCLLFLFVLGLFFGRLWLNARTGSALSIVIFVSALTLMVFLFSQTFAAFIQRFVIMSGMTWLAWTYESKRLRARHPFRLTYTTRRMGRLRR